MIVTRRRKHRDQSPLPSSHKLFADYPYPVITELTNVYKQQKSSDHSCTLLSLQWYKDGFHKRFGMLHNLRRHGSSTSVIKPSFRQTQIDRCSSKSIVNNLQKEIQPTTRIKRILASSTSPPMNDQEEQKNKRHVQKTKSNKFKSSN